MLRLRGRIRPASIQRVEDCFQEVESVRGVRCELVAADLRKDAGSENGAGRRRRLIFDPVWVVGVRMGNERMLAVSVVAAWIGTRPQQVYVLISEGVLEAVDVGKPGAKRPTWRVPEAALVEFMKTRKTSSHRGEIVTR